MTGSSCPMQLPPDLLHEAEHILDSRTMSVEPVPGGCMSLTAKMVTRGGDYFVKWGDHDTAATYRAEVEGLDRLRQACEILRVPIVTGVVFSQSGCGMLIMEWIETRPIDGAVWSEMGRGLAQLHNSTNEAGTYGYGTDNFIGRSVQVNGWRREWPAFFADFRLKPQWEQAGASGLLKANWSEPFLRILGALSDVLPCNPPCSLVHGDLWSGNVLADQSGRPVLIDPAVHYAHFEVDIAMSRLFGQFPAAFYEAYGCAVPSEVRQDSTGFEFRIREQIYNLYHLLNHLNLFGTGYRSAVESCLESICRRL